MTSRFNDHFNDSNESSAEQVRQALKQAAPTLFKRVKLWGGIALGLMVANGGWFEVSPNERANIRRLGNAVYAQALGSGPHLKIPFVDTIDRVQIALTTQQIPEIDVGTVDNQRVKLKINFNYEIADSDVNKVMYKVGEAGNSGIRDQVERTVDSVAVDTLAVRNMNDVNAKLEEIRTKMETDTFTQLKNLYGITGRRLQIESVTPSERFLDSNADAVNQKNKAVAAENALRTKEFEAKQRVVEAQGDADSVKVRAEGAKAAAILEGEGNRARFLSEVSAFGSPDKYIEFQKALAALKWNGVQPQVVAGSGSGTNLVVPLNFGPGK